VYLSILEYICDATGARRLSLGKVKDILSLDQVVRALKGREAQKTFAMEAAMKGPIHSLNSKSETVKSHYFSYKIVLLVLFSGAILQGKQ